MTKDKDLFNCGSSEDDEVIFRNVNGNPHTPINAKTGEVLLGDSDKSNDKKKMTPAEKIASVHIDFDRDNILPELDKVILEKMGLTESKPVLLKAYTIKRNFKRHIDVTDDIMQDIITETLYNPIDVFPANPNNSNYFHLAAFVEIEEKEGLKMGLVLLDVDNIKNNFEIGHAYFVDSDGFDRAKKKINKKD